MTLDAKFANQLKITGQYTYTNTKDANGTELVRRAKHIASLNLSYGFLANRANLNVGIDYTGKQSDLQFSNFFASNRIVTLDEFTLLGVAGSYKLTDNIELTGRIENLLDQEYQEVLGSDAPGIGAYVGLNTTFRLP